MAGLNTGTVILIWGGFWVTTALALLARTLIRVLTARAASRRTRLIPCTEGCSKCTPHKTAPMPSNLLALKGAVQGWIDPDPSLPYEAEVARQRWIKGPGNDWAALYEMTTAMEDRPVHTAVSAAATPSRQPPRYPPRGGVGAAAALAGQPAPEQTRPASPETYLQWLNGYIKDGGTPTHFYDYPFSRAEFCFAPGPLLTIDSDREYGARSRNIIVGKPTKTERTNPGTHFGGWGHTKLFFMNGYRCNSDLVIPVYSDPCFDEIRQRFPLAVTGRKTTYQSKGPTS